MKTNGLKVLYLFTTFPLLSETFVQREIRSLREFPVELDLYSLWGGAGEFEGLPVSRFSKWELLHLLWRVPYWMARKPSAFGRLARRLRERRAGGLLDYGMTLIGLCFALCCAHRFERSAIRPQVIHAAWATLPATAAQLLSDLLAVPFCFQAHAYDIFRNGGDWLLPSKLRESSRIMVSTEYGRDSLIARGADACKVMMIRQGLDDFPHLKAARPHREPIRILSVGRLIEKKGFAEQLELLAKLKRSGLQFEARIIGGGQGLGELKIRRKQLGLGGVVRLMGPQLNPFVLAQLQWADVFIFTGKEASDGDRDGLPNVIAEAMAFGVPVVSTDVAGVSEAIVNDRTGILLPSLASQAWRAALVRLRDDDVYYEAVREQARKWVEENFDARANVARIYEQWRSVVAEGGIAPAKDARPTMHGTTGV